MEKNEHNIYEEEVRPTLEEQPVPRPTEEEDPDPIEKSLSEE
jgi:hypothetical protein